MAFRVLPVHPGFGQDYYVNGEGLIVLKDAARPIRPFIVFDEPISLTEKSYIFASSNSAFDPKYGIYPIEINDPNFYTQLDQTGTILQFNYDIIESFSTAYTTKDKDFIVGPVYFATGSIDAQGNIKIDVATRQEFKFIFSQDYDSNLSKQGNSDSNLLYGFLGDDYIDGLDGNDTIKSGLGDDDIYGGNGKDSLYGEAGNDYIDAGEGSDFVDGGSEDDDIYGGGGADKINAGDGNDFISGDRGSDTLEGGKGDDILIGGEGRDVLMGGEGDDTYVLDDPFDKIVDSSGNDTVMIRFQISSYILNGGVDNADISGNAAITSLTGTTAGNLLIGNNSGNVLSAQAGNDTIVGGSGNDTINGGTGLDVVDYSSIDQSLTVNLVQNSATSASTGNDSLVGIEVVVAGSADDYLVGNTSANTLIGGDGDDVLSGGAGVDSLSGGEGRDVYLMLGSDHSASEITDEGSTGVDEIRFASVTAGQTLSVFAGDRGIESVVIGTGTAAAAVTTATTALNVNAAAALSALFVVGNDGANVLTGSALNDTITGNGGSDTLSGGLGLDTLTGGPGADVFRFATALNGSTNVDVITDFSIIQADKIQLENSGDGLFNAIAQTGSLLPAAFVSGQAFTAASQRIRYDAGSGNLFYDADGHGNAAELLFARLAVGLSITASQFSVI